jgi:hypothetical protein
MNRHGIPIKTLREALLDERVSAYLRLNGGYPIALAGLIYWAALGVFGFQAELYEWAMFAYFGSGMIFPVAIGLSMLLGCPFLRDTQVVGLVTAPALIGMLLFWPMVVAAGQMQFFWLIPIIMAIGMSIHWPVIGWSYGRTVLFSAHAVIRALAVLYIWIAFPEHRLSWMPLAVAAVYALTIVAILIDVSITKSRRPVATSA